MPELDEDQTAGRMDRICDPLPSGPLFFRVNSGRTVPSVPLLADESAFGDDEASTRALRIVFTHQIGRDLPLIIGTRARQRGHNDAVLQLQIAKREGREEGFC